MTKGALDIVGCIRGLIDAAGNEEAQRLIKAQLEDRVKAYIDKALDLAEKKGLPGWFYDGRKFISPDDIFSLSKKEALEYIAFCETGASEAKCNVFAYGFDPDRWEFTIDNIAAASNTLTSTEAAKPSAALVTAKKQRIEPSTTALTGTSSNNVVDESFAASAHSSLTSTTSLLGPFTRVPNRLTHCKRKLQTKFDVQESTMSANVGNKLSSKRSSTIDAPSRHCVLKLPKRQSRYLNESSEDSSDDDSAANN